VSAAAGAAVPGRAFAGCAVAVVWHDTSYFQYWGRGQAPSADPGLRLHGAVEPGCNDSGGSIPSPSSIGARAIRGVPTAVAILSQGGILIAPGYFPQVAGFPLARPGAPKDETRDCRVGAALTLSGLALPSMGRLNLRDVRSSRPIRLSGHEFIDLVIDGRTQLIGSPATGSPTSAPAKPYALRGGSAAYPARSARRSSPAGSRAPAHSSPRPQPRTSSATDGAAVVAAWGGRPRQSSFWPGLPWSSPGHGGASSRRPARANLTGCRSSPIRPTTLLS
jgi:hypothetical protein